MADPPKPPDDDLGPNEWYSDNPNDVSWITGKRRKFTMFSIPPDSLPVNDPKPEHKPSDPPASAMQGNNGEDSRLQRLASRWAILAWLVTFLPVAKFLYKSLDLASVLDFAAGLGGNPHMRALWDFANTGAGSILTMLLGLAWLTYLVLRKEKPRVATVNEQAPSGQTVAQLQEEVRKVRGEKTKLERDLGSARDGKETAEQSLAIEQKAKREVQSQLDTQLTVYGQYDRGLREQAKQIDELRVMLQDARQDAEQANQKAEEARQRANHEATMQANATTRVNDLERQIAIWKPIRDHARDQAAQINEWVRMKGVIPGEILLRDRMVTFEIRILNESVYPISICPKDIKGSLRFRAVRLKEEIDWQPDAPLITDLEPRCPALLKLQQPLRRFEAEKIQEAHEIADSDGLFWLGDLYIPISANNTPVPLIAKPLTIVEDYISISVTKFQLKQVAQIALKLTRQELIAEIEALPPDKRARAYAEAQKVYGENLENLE